jgi:hypothetical protein
VSERKERNKSKKKHARKERKSGCRLYFSLKRLGNPFWRE